MPFAGYADFDECVAQNGDKDDPEAYCAALQREVEKETSMTTATAPPDKHASSPRVNTKNLVERKNVVLEDAKFDAEAGTFKGYASVFNVKDLQNDVVLPGAFKKTIADNGGLFVLLDQHDFKNEIGLVRAREDEKGLYIDGEFYVDPQADPAKELRLARETYVKMQRRQAAGKPLQFSIGYRAINPKFEKGARLLGEIGLAEVSAVTFPALPQAMTEAVKGAADFDLKGFMEQYEAALQRRIPFTALDTALMYFWDAADEAMFATDGEAALEQLSTDLNDFGAAVMQAVASFHGMTDDEKEGAKEAIQERTDAIRATLPTSTDAEEPLEPPEGTEEHSPAEAADDGKAAFIAHLAELKRKASAPASPSPVTLSEEIRQKARNLRAQVTAKEN